MEQNSKIVITTDAVETEALGEAIGRRLRGGEVIVLASDLGGGKTTLVRGLARGAGSKDHVSSPTFTVSKVYQVQAKDVSGDGSGSKNVGGTLDIHHFDFYRLLDAGILRNEIAELSGDPRVVVVVEWSDIVRSALPDEVLTVRLQATGESERRIELQYPAALEYLISSD